MITSAAGGDGFLFEGARISGQRGLPPSLPSRFAKDLYLRLAAASFLPPCLGLAAGSPRLVMGRRCLPSISPSLLGPGAGGRSRRLPLNCPERAAFIPLSSGSRRASVQESSTRRLSATILPATETVRWFSREIETVRFSPRASCHWRMSVLILSHERIAFRAIAERVSLVRGCVVGDLRYSLNSRSWSTSLHLFGSGSSDGLLEFLEGILNGPVGERRRVDALFGQMFLQHSLGRLAELLEFADALVPSSVRALVALLSLRRPSSKSVCILD
ncbi:hypothetical protein L596_013670 [Steinernema carpocapsae]|uniref:Uncharacterized protein n=1 Tax=Steinernema carpocapsae TaxID=34508 RepID=A0A4U5P1I8_STECR|nr:hypothetical protein L596_013670 [Steinernema carpocapsae]